MLLICFHLHSGNMECISLDPMALVATLLFFVNQAAGVYISKNLVNATW